MFKKIKWLFAALLLAGLTQTSHATEIDLNKWLEKVKIKGDFRLRHENINQSSHTASSTDRQRQRLRLRLGADFQLPYHVQIKTRFASGTGEQGSTNKSFDNNSSQTSLYIDRAYLTWDPISNIGLQGGRMENSLWQTYTSDVVWDTDYNPEGFSQGLNADLGEGLNVFFNALQMVVDEDSNSTRDQYAFIEQIGTHIKFQDETRISLSGAYHDYLNEEESSFSASANPGTNRTTANGSRISQFRIFEFTGEIKLALAGLPISLAGTYVKNSGVSDSVNPKEDTGYQMGLQFGKAKKARSFELAYYYKSVEADAVIDTITDSDWGANGGTNRKGHLGWMAYAITDWMQGKVKYFDSQTINTNLDPENDVKRLQVDLETKF